MDEDDDDIEQEYGGDEERGDLMEDEDQYGEEADEEGAGGGNSTDVTFSEAAPPAQIRDFCLEKFKSIDFIMEPVMMDLVNQYFAADGEPAGAIESLANSYEGIAQYVNLFAQWLLILGEDEHTVQELIERQLETMIIKHFDPKKADKIFNNEGGVPPWVMELITHSHWRKMVYKLVEVHRDCLMLNFAIKSISDAGFQSEIPTTTTAVNQMEVFIRVFDSTMGRIVDGAPGALSDFTKLITNGECTYLAAQMIMSSLIHECPGGMNLVKIMQDVNESIKDHQTMQTQLSIAKGAAWPKVMQAVASMVAKKSLNPADIQILFQAYSSADPPPVGLLRFKGFAELLIESLFSTDPKIPTDHRPKYIFLLSYMAAVFEKWSVPSKKDHTQTRLDIFKEDLKFTQESLRKILEMSAKGNDVVSELPAVFNFLKFGVISLGMIHWIGKTVKEPSYFKFAGESRNTPAHLIIIDEIATLHPTLHRRILDLLVELFEAPWPQLDVLIRLELQKMFLDRMIHLVSCGCVLPVLGYVRSAYAKQDTDVSVFRHFVLELLDVIAPPYSVALVKHLLPLVSDNTVTGMLKHADGKDPVSVFLEDCKNVDVV